MLDTSAASVDRFPTSRASCATSADAHAAFSLVRYGPRPHVPHFAAAPTSRSLPRGPRVAVPRFCETVENSLQAGPIQSWIVPPTCCSPPSYGVTTVACKQPALVASRRRNFDCAMPPETNAARQSLAPPALHMPIPSRARILDPMRHEQPYPTRLFETACRAPITKEVIN